MFKNKIWNKLYETNFMNFAKKLYLNTKEWFSFVIFFKFTFVYLLNVNINNNLYHIHVFNFKKIEVWIIWNKSVSMLLNWIKYFPISWSFVWLIVFWILISLWIIRHIFSVHKDVAVIRADKSYLTTIDLKTPCIVKVQFIISKSVTNGPYQKLFNE